MTGTPRAGLLIVNADDWGCDRRVTDAIHACFAAGAITSTTAMMFMEDTERAAQLAEPWKDAIGLHLNLTEPYSATVVPAGARERQRRAIRALTTARVRRWLYDPSVARLVDDCISDQLERYHALYGGPPTHFDGHHHIHSCPNVFLSRRIPRRSCARLTAYRRDSGLAATVRAARGALLRRRLTTPQAFFDLRAVHPAFGGHGIEDVLRLAEHETVELMVHPGFADELPFLLSDRWRSTIGTSPRGSFAGLAA